MALDLTARAAAFAREAHKDQTRKYTREPYFNHLREVADLVEKAGGSPEMVAAAYLHDTLEDTWVHYLDIAHEFGPVVMGLVLWLTDVSRPSDGNRARRKAIDRKHLAIAPPEVQTIKYADLISNTRSIAEHDPAFAKVHLEEKRLLLEVMTGGHQGLRAQAINLTK